MATDYDAPRRTDNRRGVRGSRGRRGGTRRSPPLSTSTTDSAENFELPGADLSGEELSVWVIPKQADEFTCSSCFLVHHRSRLASEKNGVMICTDCAA